MTTDTGRPPGVQPGPEAFDEHNPPSQAIVDDCVHCGFCLPTCPTYTVWGQEMDSPRGRIDLMRQGLEGAPLGAAMVEHFDRCLGCMACVTACPSGVRYDRLIASTRQQVERRHRRPLRERLLRAAVFGLFPHPRRLRMLRGPLRLYQRLRGPQLVRRTGILPRVSPAAAAMESLLPPLGPRVSLSRHTPAQGQRRAVVGLLTGCVQGEMFPEVNAATVRVLAAEGCDVVVPANQGCCGALSLHAGREAEAARFARRTIDVFTAAGVDAVVVNAAGCGSAMKDYTDLLGDDPDYAESATALAAKVRDITELLTELGPVAQRHPLPITVAYHDACHLSHAQRIRAQPRALLAGVPGLRVSELPEPDVCCGSAGVYNLLQPDAARVLGDRKAAGVSSTGADLLVTGNPGCAMQITAAAGRAGRPLPTRHTVEVLDASLRGAPPHELTARP